MKYQKTENPCLYRCEGLSFTYHLGRQKIEALSEVNLVVQKGEFLLIMGPSGSGKSTLLNLLGLIEPLQKGKLFLKEHSLDSLTEREKNAIRRHQIGFIFQSFLLFDVLSAGENIEYFLMRQGLSKADRRSRAYQALKEVGLTDKVHHRPPELSGGQKQRIAIARALAKRPAVILADEPTASLDQKTSGEILALLRNLAESGTTVIMSSHDPLALKYAHRKLVLRDGRVEEEVRS